MLEQARALSHWGWGFAERFPSLEARRSFAQAAGALLGPGFEGLEARDPAPLDAARLPPPRVEVPRALAGFVTADREARVRHCYGRGFRDLVRGFAGDFAPAPDLVATPADEAGIEAVLAWADGARVAVIPYGGGTSVVGGVEADVGPGYNAALSLDLRGLDRVLEIDPVSRAARIQAGATGPGLEAQLAPHGLSLRHYPQSFEHSTLGGWIATRAGGHFATVYTHIDDLVESLRVLTPAGALASLRVPASGAGPSPDRLFLGSEGALGIITEAWMRLRPRPVHRAAATARFAEWRAAVAATREIAGSGLHPANCRLLDKREAALNGVGDGAHHLLVLGFESHLHPMTPWAERALKLCEAEGGEHDGVREKIRDAAAEGWKQAFLEGPYLQNQLVSLGAVADTFETACTWDRFHALHADLRGELGALMRERCGGGVLSCRFTHVYADGPAPYYTFVAPARHGGQLEPWLEIKTRASELLLAHGATITHHHAVGRLHRPWYAREAPPLFLAALRAAKAALDPGSILNPQVLWETRS